MTDALEQKPTVKTSPKNLRELLNALVEDHELPDEERHYRDNVLCDLPTFGGPEPRSTAGIWSWDTHNLLVTDVNGDFRIEPRDED